MTKEELEQKAFNVYCDCCSYCKEANAVTIEEKYDVCQKSPCYRNKYVWKLINGYKKGYEDGCNEQRKRDYNAIIHFLDIYDVNDFSCKEEFNYIIKKVLGV